VLILGNLTSYVQYLKTFQTGGELVVSVTKGVLQWIYNLIPNFQNYDVSQVVSKGQTVTPYYIGEMTVWTLMYVAFLLLMTVQFFSTKEV
jgi:hypothetical protein